MEIDFIEPGYYYHIYNRGINREKIFIEEIHYSKFLELCKKYLPEYSNILAYCLLPNHFHFLLYIKEQPEPIPGKESLFLSHLFNSYAQWFNKITDRSGGLFQRPFKRKRITDEQYLKQVVSYIHRNPLHHNLTDTPSEWLFSSYHTICSNSPTLVNREEVLNWFEDKANFVSFHKTEFDLYKEYCLEE